MLTIHGPEQDHYNPSTGSGNDGAQGGGDQGAHGGGGSQQGSGQTMLGEDSDDEEETLERPVSLIQEDIDYAFGSEMVSVGYSEIFCQNNLFCA